MMAIFRVVWAFVIRNIQTALSYRFALVLKYIGTIIQVVIFYFVYKVLGDVSVPALGGEAGGDYIAFIISGGLCMGILTSSMGGLVGEIRSGQMTGTLEAILASPMSITRLLVGSWITGQVFTAGRMLIFLGVCVVVLNFDPKMIRLDIAAVVFAVSALAFSALGVLSAAFVLAYKKGNPVALFVGSTFTLLGGVMFPVSVLPTWLQPFSEALPITYATRSMRKAVLSGPTWSEIVPDLLALSCFTAVLLPISILVFRWGLNKARRDGSLSHY